MWSVAELKTEGGNADDSSAEISNMYEPRRVKLPWTSEGRETSNSDAHGESPGKLR